MAKALDALTAGLECLTAPVTISVVDSVTTTVITPVTSLTLPTHSVKLDFPRFDRSELMHWIFRVDEFFEYYATLDNQRLTISAVNMGSTVVPWYHMLRKKGLILN